VGQSECKERVPKQWMEEEGSSNVITAAGGGNSTLDPENQLSHFRAEAWWGDCEAMF
jgi:hypothetical protein